ncbi:hypothetical protein EYC84_009697 [Monilinia fructicola]|uniref:Uncharacterized protein n=1 Tax=Monilinia fructicola TaxID=38448 RepID=A0A5M9JBY6_MONFR|nr:hypothetical protein EYC84_009697 [Monilinia fructicola]
MRARVVISGCQIILETELTDSFIHPFIHPSIHSFIPHSLTHQLLNHSFFTSSILILFSFKIKYLNTFFHILSLHTCIGIVTYRYISYHYIPCPFNSIFAMTIYLNSRILDSSND